MDYNDETCELIITVEDVNDGDFIKIRFESEDSEDDCDIDLHREGAIWLAREILQRTGETVGYEM